MSEIMRAPIFSTDKHGDALVTFDSSHTIADIARWACQNRPDGEELYRIIGEILSGVYGVVLQ